VPSTDRGTPESDSTSSGESDIEGTLQKKHAEAARDILMDRCYNSIVGMTLKGKKVSTSAKASFDWTDDALEILLSVILEKRASSKLKMVLRFHPRGTSRQERLVMRQHSEFRKGKI
jgi:hypothetical protein